MKRNLLIVMAIAVVFRIADIGQPLWYDESYTAMLIRLPFDRMVQAILGDVHPPTWYFISRAFGALFGSGEVALRLPSALLGLLSVWLAWRLARQLIGERAALVTAVLMAVSPFEVYYSNEARMYTLVTASALAASLGAVERKPWLLATGTGTLLVSHNMAVIYVPVLALLALRRFGPMKAFTSLGAGSAAWAAWLPALISQARNIGPSSGGYWIADITGNQLVGIVTQLNQLIFPAFTPSWLAPANICITCALVIFPIVEAILRRDRRAMLLAAMAFSPALTALGISLAWQPMLLSRTLAGSLPAWLALIAWWVTLPRQWSKPQIALAAGAGMAILGALLGYYRYDRSAGIRDAAAWLAQHAAPDDIVCHADGSSIVLLNYYYGGQTAVLDIHKGLHNAMSEQTMNATGIRVVQPDECAWMLYVKSPLLEQDVMPRVDKILAERHAVVAYPIYQSQASSADLLRLK